MKMTPLAISVLCLLFSTSLLRAETLPLFSTTDPPPATYTPGVPFSFEIVVPQISGMTAYSSTLTFETFSVTNPSITVSVSATSQYVFGGGSFTSNFSSSTPTPPDSTAVSYQWSDSLSSGSVSTATGVNDVLALVTVTAGDLGVPIYISLSQDPTQTYVNYSSEDLNNAPDPTIYEVNPPLILPAVPTPTAWLILAIGVVVLAVRSHLANHPRFRLG